MPKQRLLSLDVFRGLTVALMILVNNPGSWAHIYALLRHAHWHGCTPTDLVFPFFLFAMGVAMSFSFAGRLGAGTERAVLARRVVVRSLILFGLGLVMNAVPFPGWPAFRLWGVLQRIGWCYLLAGLAVILIRGVRGRVALLFGLLMTYEFLMRWPLVPGWGAGSFALTDNFARWLDLSWPGAAHLYQGQSVAFDPEGLVSSLPATAGVLAGFLVGGLLRQPVSLGKSLRRLVTSGLVLVGAGWLLGHVEPLNKQLWTVSYAVLTTGLACLVLAGCTWWLDVRGWHGGARPAIAFGSNALLAFVGAGFVACLVVMVRVTGAEGASHSLKSLLHGRLLAVGLGPETGSLIYALGHVLLWWVVVWYLHRRRVFIKI